MFDTITQAAIRGQVASARAWADRSDHFATDAGVQMALLAATLESVNRLTEHVISESLRRGVRCEIVDHDGECGHQAVAYQWQDAFGDPVCTDHAAVARGRGAMVIYGRRHDGDMN
ncbi:hypothetical protein [Gordonia sihwensis]|uniref:hypothetical protein n=1 Tax=Gordonia sihwensis TaxID=173559 RepID=UPI003D997B6D